MPESGLNLCVCIPFLTEREAKIAHDVLRVDQEPPRSHITKCLVQDKNFLNVSFSATSPQQLRVGVNGFIDQIALFAETLEKFGPPVSLEYSC